MLFNLAVFFQAADYFIRGTLVIGGRRADFSIFQESWLAFYCWAQPIDAQDFLGSHQFCFF
ncbi:hypothetical protein [Streptomyces graminofaciens]|uniref:hypothetical protein n=1 Tax=Streptomyces graminofaciens TaxID=68212 RepID=UPI0025734E94|nr:hypothetical protein [Streptomyces graminofaciens]